MVICQNAKICGVPISKSDKKKDEEQIDLCNCDHALPHDHSWRCKNSTCMRIGGAASGCVEIVEEVVTNPEDTTIISIDVGA